MLRIIINTYKKLPCESVVLELSDIALTSALFLPIRLLFSPKQLTCARLYSRREKIPPDPLFLSYSHLLDDNAPESDCICGYIACGYVAISLVEE